MTTVSTDRRIQSNCLMANRSTGDPVLVHNRQAVHEVVQEQIERYWKGCPKVFSGRYQGRPALSVVVLVLNYLKTDDDKHDG